MPKSATLSGIKSLHCYTIQEAAAVSGVSDRTIRAWMKDGLSAMKQERPTLLRGDALIAFIKGQRKSRKTKIKQDEFYCLKCRDARKPAERMVECEIRGARAKLTAICDDCETIMHKPVALGQVPNLAEVFDLTVKSSSETLKTPTAE
jgi:transcription elongation factor Elf1